MEIFIDGEPYKGTGFKEQTLLGILEGVQRELDSRKRAVIGLRIDGQDVLPEEIEGFRRTNVSDLGRIEILTGDRDSLIKNALLEVKEVLPALVEAVSELSRMVRTNTDPMVMDNLKKISEIWGALNERLQHTASALKLDLREIAVEGESVEERFRQLNRFLLDAANATQDRDFVLLGDILEYELAPRLMKQSSVVEQFLSTIKKET